MTIFPILEALKECLDSLVILQNTMSSFPWPVVLFVGSWWYSKASCPLCHLAVNTNSHAKGLSQRFAICLWVMSVGESWPLNFYLFMGHVCWGELTIDLMVVDLMTTSELTS